MQLSTYLILQCKINIKTPSTWNSNMDFTIIPTAHRSNWYLLILFLQLNLVAFFVHCLLFVSVVEEYLETELKGFTSIQSIHCFINHRVVFLVTDAIIQITSCFAV